MNKNILQSLPLRFTKNASNLCGAAGEEWLDALPQIVSELSEKWSLTVENVFPDLSYNFVAPCFCSDGSRAVLKIALPLNDPEIFIEAAFLKISDGNGAVQLLKTDENRRAILLERLLPGRNLKENYREDDAKTVGIAINLMRRISKETPANQGFRRLQEWFDDFFVKAPKTNFPFEFVNRSRRFFEELCSEAKQTFLIHGDLHHENILSAEREPFLAIDPKGIIGTRGYEIAVFLNNHLWWLDGQPDLKGKLKQAVKQFSGAFEIAEKDLRKWAYVQMVLSAWWTFEDNGETWDRELAFAEFWEV